MRPLGTLNPLRSSPWVSARRVVAVICVLVGTTTYAAPGKGSAAHGGKKVGCSSAPVEKDGVRLLALVVGVGKYKNPDIPPLLGPANDANDMARVLGNYGFPKENVCVLEDADATLEAFRQMFDKALVQRARPKDIAVVYFAGHGGQANDEDDGNRDEPSGLDSTLVFHDSFTNGITDLVDDEFNQMLDRLHQRTHEIVVILDSCHSQTATRGPASDYRVRAFKRPGLRAPNPLGPLDRERTSWAPASMPGIVVMAAAADESEAREKDGHGIFTKALVELLSQVRKDPLQYFQLKRLLPPALAPHGQIPFLYGDVDKPVFAAKGARRPPSWLVRKVGPTIELQGTPLPGMGKGAKLLIFTPTPRPAEYADPRNAKALVVVDQETGLNATVHVTTSREGVAQDSAKVRVGDVAILVEPGDKATQISVAFRNVSAAREQALRTAISKSLLAGPAVTLAKPGARGDWTLQATSPGALEFWGPDKRVHNLVGSDEDVPTVLWRHAQQAALLNLQPQGGADFVAEKTLQVALRPAEKQDACGEAKRNDWVQARPGDPQVVPLCLYTQIAVTLSSEAKESVLVSGLILSSDGTTSVFPPDGSSVKLQRGQTHVFEKRIRATPPLDSFDYIRIVGTPETNQLDWLGLVTRGASRGAARATSTLQRAIDRYLGRTRGFEVDSEGSLADTTWTATTLVARAEANPRFPAGNEVVKDPDTLGREYTIPGFDLRPYYPDDDDTALYKVLREVDWITSRNVAYSQGTDWTLPAAAWSRSAVEERLKGGIDCTHVLWLAFRLANLPYGAGNEFVPTISMAAADSPMKASFDRCDVGVAPGEVPPGLRLGDILVFQEETLSKSCDHPPCGHAVMVIDPERRVAWGAHAWGGKGPNSAALKGVKFQRIKETRDWNRWDLPNVKLKGCWRYRRFAQEAESGRGLPGVKALQGTPCDPTQCTTKAPAHPADAKM